MDHIVGFGFRPTDEELVNHYLNNKILGQTWLVDNAINEVNICSFDPWDLRFQSKLGSNDYVWYFFCGVENKRQQSRKTSSGYWKKTGPTLDIKPRRGNRGKIGEKKVLVFHRGRTPNGVGTEWVMHEYHSTFFPLHQRTYVICRVEFKGEHLDIPSVNGMEPNQSSFSNFNNVAALSTGSEVNQPVHGSSGSFLGGPNQFNTQQEAAYLDEDETERFLESLTTEDWDFMFCDEEIAPYRVMQENCNAYRPHESLSGLYTADFSDSDAESTTSEASPNETWSPVGSAGSSNGEFKNHKNGILASGINGRAEGQARRLQLQRVTPPKKEKQMVDEEDKRIKCWFVFEEIEVYTSRRDQAINIIIILFILFFPLFPLFLTLP